jgi:hypothetical protein
MIPELAAGSCGAAAPQLISRGHLTLIQGGRSPSSTIDKHVASTPASDPAGTITELDRHRDPLQNALVALRGIAEATAANRRRLEALHEMASALLQPASLTQ